MKKTIVKTDNYLLVVDNSVINLDDWVYTDTQVLFQYGIEHKRNPSTKKVIAHLPFGMYSTLEGVPLLPPLEVEDDVWSLGLKERLDELPYTKHLDDGGYNDGQVVGFEIGAEWGYKKAREKYNFTELDIQKAFTHCAKYTAECVRSGVKFDFLGRLEMYLESLSQPKTPTHFEFEMERGDLPYYVIKTTTNSQGQEVACGKYVYAS